MPLVEKTRDLTSDERDILRLLVGDNAGLRSQLDKAWVIAEYSDNDPSIVLMTPGRDAKLRVPRTTVGATAPDNADGREVAILLHLVDGYLDELEFFRYDSLPVDGLPHPAAISLKTSS